MNIKIEHETHNALCKNATTVHCRSKRVQNLRTPQKLEVKILRNVNYM